MIGTGGYVSAPSVLAAYILKIPTIIHEQNSHPGLANKLLSRIVDVVATSYPNGEKMFSSSKRVVYTGNPVRRKMIGVIKEKGRKSLTLDKDKMTVLIFGGSLGAKKINDVVVEGYKKYKDSEDIQVVHITGERHFDEICKKMKKVVKLEDKLRYQAHPYLNNISDAYAAADLVVSRAGANTIAEITAIGIPAILVPYPHATSDHQYKNAKELERHGAARIIKDDELNAQTMFKAIDAIVFNSVVLAKMKEKSSSLGKPFAANDLAKFVLDQSNKVQKLKA